MSARLNAAFAALLALGAADARADIYGRIDSDGGVHLTDRDPGEGFMRLIADSGREPAPSGPRSEATWPYAGEVRAAAARHGVDPLLVHAVIRAESSYDPRARSPRGAAGLMQLMPDTARRYGVADRFDPVSNLEGGVRYLRDLLALFRGDTRLALAAFNAGEGAVLRHNGRIPPYPESLAYVARVELFYARDVADRAHDRTAARSIVTAP